MRPEKTALRSDAGFSAMELMIASIIGLMVLIAAYLLFETGMKAFRDINNTTTQTRVAASCVQRISKPLREGIGFTKARDYEIEFTADPDNDHIQERLRFFETSGTTNLMLDTATYNAGTSSYSTVTVTVGDGLRNMQNGVPLFTYLSAVNVPITGMEASKTAGVKIVHVRVVEQAVTTPTPVPYQIDTDIFLRNATQ